MAPNLIRVRGELAFGADLTSDPLDWVWSDLDDPATRPANTSGRIADDGTLRLRAGRSGEGSRIGPAHFDLTADNHDDELTPSNPLSQWWPNLDIDRHDLPARLAIKAGSLFLTTPSATTIAATTPDDADFDITGDLTWRCLIFYYGSPQATVFLPPRKYTPTGDQRSWLPMIDTDGHLRLRWSPDGTLVNGIEAVCPVAIPWCGIIAVGGRLDVDNGSGGWTVTFEIAAGRDALDTPDADWTTIGTDTDTGTTSIHSGTSVLQGPQSCPYPVFAWRLYDGLGAAGTLESSVDIRDETEGAASFAAATGETWTVAGEITGWRPRAQGFVSSIQPTAPHGSVSGTQRVTIGSDGELRRLEAGEKPLQSAITRLITAPSNSAIVVADWPFEDGRTATVAASSIPGGDPMTLKGDYNPAGDSDLPGHAPVLTVSSGQNLYRQADIPQIPQVAGVVWEVAQFLRIDDPAVSPAFTQLMAVDTNGRVETWRVFIDDTNVTVTGHDLDGTGVVLSSVPSDPRYFTTPMLIVVLRVEDDGADVDWSVGIIPTNLGAVFSGGSGTFTGNTGVPNRFRNSCTGPPSGIALGHTVVTTGTNLAGGISWVAPADSGFVGEAAGRRAVRLCAEEQVALTVIGDPDDTAKMGPQGIDEFSALLRDCAEVDGGLLFDGGPGGLTLRTRRSLENQPVAMTLDGGDTARPFESLRPNLDDKRRRTHQEVIRPDGGAYTAVDEAYDPTAKRIYDESTSRNVADDLDLPNQAGWLLSLGGTGLRHPQVNITPSKTLGDEDQALIDEWLAMLPGQRIQVLNPGVGSAGTIDALVDGWSENVAGADWAAAIAAVPADPWTVAVWDDDTLGRYDTAGSTTDADFDAGTDTALVVDINTGPLWTTDSGEMPIVVAAAGVELNVTAISGATSPQTFTVDATPVNGVAKTIPAGSDLRLAQPAIRSL